ncbi:MAG: hypothetical protein FWD48_12065 [Oscillospiraceae bacterium]|nr:hypothetical protein [Oscillospiraceae bacterium]
MNVINSIGDYIGIFILLLAISFWPFVLLSYLYKGKKKTIKIIDKWVKSTAFFSHDPGHFKRYIVVYCKKNNKPSKGQIAYCFGYIYDELEVGETYLVKKRFKTIKKIYS